MATYKTPGVYAEEISTLPPSVAEVSTAIPAFLGYTEKGSGLARISTLLEYQTIFGGPKPSSFAIETELDSSGTESIAAVTRTDESTGVLPEYLMYYALHQYYRNGGGACYVVSVGNYGGATSAEHFEDGLGLLAMEDEPTLILLTDAINLDKADYYTLCQSALAQCNKLGDRFAILDVPDGNGNINAFRNGIQTSNLKYGAAYLPYLQTTQGYVYDAELVQIVESLGGGTLLWSKDFDAPDGITVNFSGDDGATPAVKIVGAGSGIDFVAETESRQLTISGVTGKDGQAVLAAWNAWLGSGNDPTGFSVAISGAGTSEISNTSNSFVDLEESGGQASAGTGVSLRSIETTKTSLYNQIKAALAGQRVILPPSSAVAGIYSRVDRERGVWKAPANESVSGVIGPVSKITHDEQADLNVDPSAGKSINAIREFTGKGTLVWGARTLAGNDNEWRYISVRRLFNLIEESTRKATSFAVFESNDATTWLKVKGMIDSYLYSLWERGALAGSTPEAAYFVNIGLGKTMTSQDILEGRMIVEIGVAAVRPAEFIIIRFTHKLQEA